jgi:hypothetical protein
LDRLISDIVVRRTAQTLVLAMLTGLIALCVVLDVFVHLSSVGRLDEGSSAVAVFAFLASPLQQTFSGLLALFTVLIPVVFASVCYVINKTATPPTAGDHLNIVGHAAFLLTMIGVLVGAVTLVLFTVDAAAVTSLAATRENAASIQGLVNGVIAFNGVYLTQLLGLKPK